MTAAARAAWRCGVLGCALLGATGVGAAEPLASAQAWYTLSIDGVRAGFVEMQAARTQAAATERLHTHVVIRQLGHRSTLDRRVDMSRDASGALVTLRFESRVGTVHVAWEAMPQGDHLHVTPLAGHGGDTHDLQVPPGARIAPLSPTEDFRSLWHDGERLRHDTVFDIDAQRFVARDAERLADDPAAQGSVRLRVTWHRDAGLRVDEMDFDAASGALRHLGGRALGGALDWTPCQNDCDANVANPVDPMDRLVVRSPVWIPISDTRRTLRFLISRNDAQAPVLRATPEQAVVAADTRAVVTVCANCGAAEPASGEDLARFLRPNAWVRSDDAEIRHVSTSTVSPVASTDWRMRKLADFVTRRMHGTIDFLGYADAVTALHTGSGDCTEFAVLLAALARAQGIPARVVVGIAYSDHFSGKSNVFSPHTWVQAWTGQAWHSYDAALNGFDSTHIAFAVGDGTPDELDRALAQLGHLQIEKAAVVREPDSAKPATR